MAGSSSPPILDIRACRSQSPIDASPFHEWVSPDGTPWTAFYRDGSDYLLRFPELADFTVSANGREVAAYPVPGTATQTIEHLYLNQVLPLALSRQWKLVLHASAIEIGDVAVAFMGMSGRGKSTLAASFATNGYRFLTDDGLQLEKDCSGYQIQPSHPSIRLWDDSRQALIPDSTQTALPVDYSPKARLLADDAVVFCDKGRPLRYIYFLGDGEVDDISTVPVRGRDAVIELVKNSFLLDIEETEMLSHHFSQLTEMAKRPVFFRLDYPRRYDKLAAVRQAIIGHVTQEGKVATD